MRSLERRYRLMYRLGLTPWDAGPFPPDLHELATGTRMGRPGIALDLGCGTGRHAAELAGLGWSVLAVDASPVAITRARARTSAVDWLLCDLRALPGSQALREVAGRVDLVVDLGCLHGLDDSGREAWASAVAIAAAPGAAAFVSAAPPSRRPGLPRGISSYEIGDLLGPTWRLRARTASVFDHGR